MRPAAEDGVRETGAALGAPHQLHQLFSQFGHDGVPASGSWLSGLLPRHMGKGRLRRPAWRDGSGKRAGRLDGRKATGERPTCRDRACQARSERQRGVSRTGSTGATSGFSFTTAPKAGGAGGASPEAEVGGLGRAEGGLASTWRLLSSVPGPGGAVASFVLGGASHPVGVGIFLPLEYLLPVRTALGLAGVSEAQALGPRNVAYTLKCVILILPNQSFETVV